MNKYTAIFSIVVACLLAVEVQAFTVSPIGFRATIEPGGQQIFNIVGTNNESDKHRFKIDVNSVRSTEEGKRYYESGADQAEFWAKADPEVFTLSPGAAKTVAVTFKVPAGAQSGAHALAFMVASENLERTEFGLTARSAIPLNLVVSGEVVERLIFKKFELKDKVTGKNIWPASIELYNDGSMDVQSTGWLEVKDMFHKKVYSQPVLLGNAIYPQSSRRHELSMELSNGLWPGKYSAKLIVQYGASKSTISAESTTWYLPVWLAGVVFVLMSVLIIWLWRRRKIC